MENIPLWSKLMPVICIYCDNQVAISRAQNLVYNSKPRHIHRRYNTVRQLLSNGVISIDFVTLKYNLTDLFTKKLSREHLNCVLKEMRLKIKLYRVCLLKISLSDWGSHRLSLREKTGYD